MVNPFPDGTTDEEVGALHRIPVIHQVTAGITHGVCIFRDVVRILDVVLACHRSLYPSDGRILVGTYIDDVVVSFVLHRTTQVECPDGIVSGHEVIARTGFVTQAPEAYRRMVDAGTYHFHISCHVSSFPTFGMRGTFLTIIILVAFDVRLVFQVDAILVAQPIPIRRTRIVRVTNVVDVHPLHQHHFFGHTFTGDVMPLFRIAFVTVHPFHLDRLAIEVIVTARQSEFILIGRSILDFDFAEAYSGREGFYHTSLLVFQFAHQRIAIRLFGIPRLHGCTGIQGCLYLLNITRQELCHRYIHRHVLYQGVFIAIQSKFIEGEAQRMILHLLLVEVLEGGSNIQLCLCISIIIIRNGHDVLHLYLRLGSQRYTTEDTRQAHHILRFEERTVAVAVHLGSHDVLAFHQVRSDVELSQVTTVLRETYVLAVDVKVEERINTVKVDIHLAVCPIGRDSKRTTV